MKLHNYTNRAEYLETQIDRSRNKMGYCKVFFRDIFRYQFLLALDQPSELFDANKRWQPQNIVCLGVRAGAEVDLFRAAYWAPLLRLKWLQQLAAHFDNSSSAENKTRLARLFGLAEKIDRSSSVIGVELNPDVFRRDVHVGSFDDLPLGWEGRFDLLFTNSFDHSLDPARTVNEWKRVAAPGAYVIIAFAPTQELSDHDPVSGLNFEALSALWQAPIVFASESQNRNGYHEICFRLE